MIKLNSGIMWQLMAEIIQHLQANVSRELSHFKVEKDDCWELCAYFKGSGLIPSKTVVVLSYPSNREEQCQKMADDLNALFNLTDPDAEERKQNELEERDELVMECLDLIEAETDSMADESQIMRKMAMAFSGFITLEQAKRSIKEVKAFSLEELEFDFEAAEKRRLDRIETRRG